MFVVSEVCNLYRNSYNSFISYLLVGHEYEDHDCP